jgi:alkylation response protein AidB-like acyl-CoA dehydrogenase
VPSLSLIQVKGKQRRFGWNAALRRGLRTGDQGMDQVLPDVTDYVACARALGPMLTAAADDIERDRGLPAPVVSAMSANGLFRLLQPRALGGAELDPMTYIRVIEELARRDASTGWCVEQANGCSMVAAFLDPDVAHEIFGPPDGIVAWGPVGPADLMAVPGGYRLSGAWNFASGSHHATWLGAHVVMRGADGEPLRRPDGGEMLRTLLFPKSAARMTDIWHVVGLRGTGSDRYEVEGLFIPERYTVVRDPRIAPRQGGRLYAFSSSNLYATGVAAVALGIARGMIADFTELATAKVPRGARQPLCENQVIQSQLAQAEARLRSARAFLLSGLGEIWDEVGKTGELTLQQNTIIRLAATWAIHQARQVVDTLYHSAGATAIFDNRPFERRFRDMHTATQQAQGRQAHYETIGAVLFGLAPDTAMFTF